MREKSIYIQTIRRKKIGFFFLKSHEKRYDNMLKTMIYAQTSRNDYGLIFLNKIFIINIIYPIVFHVKRRLVLLYPTLYRLL